MTAILYFGGKNDEEDSFTGSCGSPGAHPEPETTAPAETGIALALVPMAIAAAGIVISKRR